MNFKVCVPVGLLLLTMACHQPSSPDQQAPAAAGVALQAPYNQVFYDSLGSTMQTYFRLAEAFTAADSSKAGTEAALLKLHVDSLPVNLLQMDSTHLAGVTGITGSISAELAGLAGEKGLEGKRSSFQMVSDMMFDLVKTTGWKGHTVYREFCPMAAEGNGAYWLSEKAAIKNPYFGEKMLTCGETRDSLIYK
ncbi:DUF3347 domain-containing protein [Chitinophaga sp. 212800010-3]|uniref:DUF3347 domain-containing protein n=1 Tax=unclassified Chitinophaga TaxID=2619133 RepID=UPI002DEE5247|nr:DUF3347 domain-containing protein [Chitinophaga sp. 212800010-3]